MSAKESGMLRTARHPENINGRNPFRKCPQGRWSSRAAGPANLAPVARCPKLSPHQTKAWFCRCRPRVLAIHGHGVVSGGLGVPHRARRTPAPVLNRRIPEVGEQIQALREEADVHPIGMTVALAGVVIKPGRPCVGSFARPEDGQTPLRLVHARQLDLGAVLGDDLCHLRLKPGRFSRE